MVVWGVLPRKMTFYWVELWGQRAFKRVSGVNVWVRGRKEVVGEGNWREERKER